MSFSLAYLSLLRITLVPPGLDPGIRPCVESVPEPEHSSPVLTWILGYFWSLPRGVSPRLVWGHASALSSRDGAAVSCFPSSGSRNQWLFLESFPQGFPTRLFHRAVPRHVLASTYLSSLFSFAFCASNSLDFF